MREEEDSPRSLHGLVVYMGLETDNGARYTLFVAKIVDKLVAVETLKLELLNPGVDNVCVDSCQPDRGGQTRDIIMN